MNDVLGVAGAALLTVVVLALAASQLVLFVSATIEARHIKQREKHHLWDRALSSTVPPKVTVVIPAYNEEVTIGETSANILGLNYPNLEVVIVIDGGTDDTLGVLDRLYELVPVHSVYQHQIDTATMGQIYRSSTEPNLIVAEKANGGKADSMNAGINLASGELICFIDADTLIAPTALQQLAVPFIERDGVVASGGMVRHANGATIEHSRVTKMSAPNRILPGAQAVEYIRAFMVGRLGWNKLGGNIIISGAFGLFDRSSLLAVGGHEPETIAEDMELVVRLRRWGYETNRPAHVVFTTTPCSWTEVPETIEVLANQRGRWHRGLLDVLKRHREMLFNRKYGAAGMAVLPYYLLVEFIAPILELIGLLFFLYALANGSATEGVILVVVCAYLTSLLLTFLVLLGDELINHPYERGTDRLKLVLHAVMESTVIHLGTLLWRLVGMVDALLGRNDWGTMTRKGFRQI